MECNLSRFLLYMAHNQQRSLHPRHHPRVLLSHAHINHGETLAFSAQTTGEVYIREDMQLMPHESINDKLVNKHGQLRDYVRLVAAPDIQMP